MNGIAGDASCLFHGDTPGVDRLGDERGIAGDCNPLVDRLSRDGRDGVGRELLGVFSRPFIAYSRLLRIRDGKG